MRHEGECLLVCVCVCVCKAQKDFLVGSDPKYLKSAKGNCGCHTNNMHTYFEAKPCINLEEVEMVKIFMSTLTMMDTV